MEDNIQKMLSMGWCLETLKVAMRAEFKCEYCGTYLFESIETYDYMEMDHIIPKSKGGGDNYNNLAWSCRCCNLTKKYYNPKESYPNEDVTRDELIKNARFHIEEKKKKKLEKILIMKNLSLSLEEVV